jgi:hypothetical protein
VRESIPEIFPGSADYTGASGILRFGRMAEWPLSPDFCKQFAPNSGE